MNRYRSYGQGDDQPQIAGDQAFLGVNEYDVPQNLQPGEVQKAVNIDFKTQAGATRGGFVCLPELSTFVFGQHWSSYVVDPGATLYGGKVAFGNGIFVNVGQNRDVQTSPDGKIWTNRSFVSTGEFYDVEFFNGRFLAVGFEPFTTPSSYYSNDGIGWTASSVPFEISAFLTNGLTFGDNKWVAVVSLVAGGAGITTSLNNGVSWTTPFSVAVFTDQTSIKYFNGLFVAATGSVIYTSSNLTTWTAASFVGGTTPVGTFVSLVFGNKIFVALTTHGEIFKSTDGLSWTRTRVLDGSSTWTDGTFGNSQFVCVNSNGQVISSISGEAWNLQATGLSYSWTSITFGNNSFVAVGIANRSMITSSQAVYASALFSDPNNANEVWAMLAGYDRVGFYAQGRTGRTIALDTGEYVTQQSTIVQANNEVYLFRGEGQTPLYWDGNWNGKFVPVPNTTLPATFESIPSSNQATFYQNRLWVINGKDNIAASDVLAFTDYDPLANEISTNTGNSDYLVATFPFGQNSLVAFKNKSIQLLQNVEGSLADVTTTEVTRQVGLIGINAVCSVGPDLAYASYGNINLLTLTATNNALQHKTLPLSARIRKIMDRVNWEVGYKISMGYWNNKLYVALPLDNSIFCNGVVVYNFITQTWYGEWNFSDTMNMCIQGFQVLDYLGLQRLHAITEDGRMFVTDEGQNDISGITLAEISSELTTRAYMVQNLNHFQRRMFMDIGTNRPNFTVTVYTDGASEENTLITGQTYSRSESWKFNDSAYDLTNVNDDYNRAYRKDYSTGPNSVQTQSGFQPEMLQEQRLPLITRRQGRLSWIKVQNTQGLLSMRTLGYETRPGQRSNLTQV